MVKFREYLELVYKYQTAQRLKIWLNRNNSFFKEKIGLEIGGPSKIFGSDHWLPLYNLCKSLDGCNFSTNTVWEGEINKGDFLYNDQKLTGYQYICEADNLSSIEDEKYDFILSCHSLEHIANPIKALSEWKRVLKKGGVLLIIVPEKKFTFDHRRNYTNFQHLIEDYENNVDETDLTHVDEILSLHDLKKETSINDFDQFKNRSLLNYQYRCLHHHVYNLKLLKQTAAHLHLEYLSGLSFISNSSLVLMSK